MKQLDLFEDNYLALSYLLDIAEKLNPSGGFYENGSPIPQGYKLDFYKDLAFIVLYKDETFLGEKVIDNAIYLESIGDGLFVIYKIDGAIFGEISNNDLFKEVLFLLDCLKNKVVFKNY